MFITGDALEVKGNVMISVNSTLTLTLTLTLSLSY